MLMVITVLVTLSILAVAFAPMMQSSLVQAEHNRLRERTDIEARLLLRHAHDWLSRGEYSREVAIAAAQASNGTLGNPDVDTRSEFEPGETFRSRLEESIQDAWMKDPALSQRLASLQRQGLQPFTDDRGSIWSVGIEDAQALVNINGAAPFLLANLLGSALVAEDLDGGASDIPVKHVTSSQMGAFSGFPADGGFIRIGNEVIRYGSFDGEAFRDCERAVLRDVPLADNGVAKDWKENTPVIDYAAWKIAAHLVAAHPGRLTPFTNLEDVQSVAGWGKGHALDPTRLDQIRPFLTGHSRRETAEGWLGGQQVTQQLPTSVDGTEPDEVILRDVESPTGTTWWFNPGTLARITDGRNTAYQFIASIGDGDGGQIDQRLQLAGSVNAGIPEEAAGRTFEGSRTSIEGFAPYPININTASLEVLYAVMANLQHRRSSTDDHIVTPKLALRLAKEILRSREGPLKMVPGTDDNRKWRRSGPFRHAEDWGRFLDERLRTQQITRAQHYALYTNAVAPHSRALRFGTAPWCFRTMDVYHVEARVAVNNRSGDQVAAATLREVVQIGAEGLAEWSVDSQADFEMRLQQGSGAKFVATYPFKVTWIDESTHHVHPRPRAPQQVARGVYPSANKEHNGENRSGTDVGDVRLEPVRMRLPGHVLVEHFDHNTYQDGHFTGHDGPYRGKVEGTFRGENQDHVRPFSMSFWWRCFSESSSWTAFDTGMEQFTNRFAIFASEHEGEQQLVFRVCAGTLEERAAEVYVPFERLDYRPGNWYHIHVSCVGEDPSTMQLLVDGVDLGKRRGLAFLSSSLDDSSTEVVVESTAGFPDYGAIQIGTEIIEYESLAGGAFRDCTRGARGTAPQTWSTGAAVRMLGYTMPVTVDIMKGGRYLGETLRKWSAVRVVGEYDDTTTVNIEGVPTPVQVGGFNSSNTNPQNFHVTAMWGQDAAEAVEAFGSSGLALLGCPSIANEADGGSGGENVGGWEIVSYTRQQQSFTVTRFQETAWQDAAEPYFLATQIVTIQQDWPCFLVPISTLADAGTSTAGEDYLDPADETDAEILSRYYTDGDQGARVLLPNEQGQVEVIAYDSIERDFGGQGILFVRDRNISGTVEHFFGQDYNIDVDDPADEEDPDTDPDPEPEPDPDPVPDPEPDPGPDEEPDPDTFPGGPGGGVPPGLRDPEDAEGGPDPDIPDSGDGDDPSEPGTGDPDDGDDGDTGPGDGDIEPVDPGDGSEPDPDEGPSGPGGGADPGLRDPGEGEDGADDGSGDSGGGSGGGDSGGGSGESPPDEIDPPPDNSGGGDEEEPNPDEFDGGPGGHVPPDLRDPEDPDFPEDAEEGAPSTGGTGQGAGWDPAREPDGPETARQILAHRGVNGTFDRDHLTPGGASDETARFLPCFRVREGADGLPRRAGRNDVITAVLPGAAGSPPDRYELRLRWGDENSHWVAADDFITERVPAAQSGANGSRYDWREYPRILKFPCGELPDEMPEEFEFGQSQVSSSGLVTAFLDELHIWRHPMGPLGIVIDEEGISGESTGVTLGAVGPALDFEDLDGYMRDVGVFLLDGELFVYRGTENTGADQIRLDRVARGTMGTQTRAHALGSYGTFLPALHVSYLEGSLTPDSASLGLASTENWPQEGLVRVVGENTGELIHFTHRTEESLLMPEAMDAHNGRARGLFRGRFGTEAADHDSDSLVIFTPSRYWDRYTPRRTEDNETFAGVHVHPETSYFELGTKVRDAWWHAVRWEENLDGALRGDEDDDRGDGGGDSGYLDLMVLARFNPNVPWDSRRVIDLRQDSSFGGGGNTIARQDHLMVMNDPEQANRIGFEAGTAEFRVFFVYKPNAYRFVDLPGSASAFEDGEALPNDWKKTPWLSGFTVSYVNRTRAMQKAKAGMGR